MTRWEKLNSPRLNSDYIEKLFKFYKINKYNFIPNGYGDYYVEVSYGLFDYKLDLNIELEKLFIFKKDSLRKWEKGSKEYRKPCKTFSNDIWLNSIKYIKKNK